MDLIIKLHKLQPILAATGLGIPQSRMRWKSHDRYRFDPISLFKNRLTSRAETLQRVHIYGEEVGKSSVKDGEVAIRLTSFNSSMIGINLDT
jgi:hypothetical protein